MQDMVQEYVQGLESSSTIKCYTCDLNKFMLWYKQTEGSFPGVEQVGPLDIAEFKRYCMNKKQKPSTVNRAISSLSSFFNWVVSMGYITHNPAQGIKHVTEQKAAPASLDRKALLRLTRAANQSGKTRDSCIITVLLHTGLRVSELCALTLDDIKISERSGTLVVWEGKGLKYREVPLNSTVRNAIKDWYAIRGTEPGYLFPGRGGNKLSSRTIEYLLEKYSYDARIEKVTPHSLRHTFCKMLVDAGESLDRVALLAGHENINTTARYTRASNKDLRDAVDKLSWE